MTDGPYRSLKVDGITKIYTDALQDETLNLEERVGACSHSITRQVLVENRKLIQALLDYASSPTLKFDATNDVKGIFERESKSLFSEDLRRELALKLHERKECNTALDNAIDIAVRFRFKDLCNVAHEAALKRMGKDDKGRTWFDEFAKRNRETFEGRDVTSVREALKRDDKDTFKRFASKKTGVDEGVPI